MSIRNPVYVTEDQTRINVEYEHKQYGWIPMTLSREDYPELWDDAINQIPLPFDKPTPEEARAEAAREIRYERDTILRTVVDPIVSNPLRWGDMSEADQYAYKVYRQALLDITDQPQFPTNVEWPILVLSTRS